VEAAAGQAGRPLPGRLSGEIEVDAIELVLFAAVTGEDVRWAGEPDHETLRRRAAHAGPSEEDTLVYPIEFHVVSPAD
jgi:hypothetical protein